jgi:hypothetical protein
MQVGHALLPPLVGFSQSSRTGLLPALQWEEAPEGFGQPLHCRVAGGGLGDIAHSIRCTSATMAMNRYPFWHLSHFCAYKSFLGPPPPFSKRLILQMAHNLSRHVLYLELFQDLLRRSQRGQSPLQTLKHELKLSPG